MKNGFNVDKLGGYINPGESAPIGQTKGFNLPAPTQSYTNSINGTGSGGNTSTGGSNWVDNFTKLGALGLAAYNDYENREYRDDVFNFNAREKNDKNARDRSIQNQLTGGSNPLEREDQPYR